MDDAPKSIVQECATCGTLIDVTDEQPLALRHCPNCGAAMRVRRHFNQFELQEALGAGGMGTVYRALDANLNRPVALKLLRPEHSQNSELIASFAKEAAITASINHPHVVRVYSTGTDHGIFYIAMELVDKGSLDDLMTLQGKVGEVQVLEVGTQIAQGLNAAAQRGLIHRDVKPGNILFADAHNAKIVDFGLAVLQEHANHGDGPVWGTPYYVAPEKLEAEPHEDFRSDMYSLGATLFHALSGRPPFDAETVSMLTLKHLKSQSVRVQSFAPDISSATAYVINKMLHKDPAQRFASYDELIENLQYARNELLGISPAGGKRPGAVEVSTGWITMTMATLTVAAGLSLYHFRDQLPGHTRRAEATPAVRPAATDFDGGYSAARDQIAAGKYAEAATALRALDAQEGAPQPLRNWITMNAALALLLAGQPEEATKELQEVVERGLYSSDPAEKKIAEFFVNTARLGVGEGAQAPDAAKDFDRTNHESFALLLLGAKDWGLGAFDEAAVLFEQFQAAAPDERSAWVNAFKPLAANRLADLATYRRLAQAANAAAEIDALKKTVADVKAAREKQKDPGKLAEKLAEIEAMVSKQLAALEEAKAMKDAEMEAAETKALTEALAQMNAFFAAFKFAEASRIVGTVSVTGEARKTERDGWVKKCEWLARFKTGLINDINILHYSLPLRRKNGTTIQFGLGKASDAVAEMVTPYGNVPVPWTDLSVESVMAVAQSFLRVASREAAPDRQWTLGVFLHTFGKKTEAQILLHQAAESKADYQPFLPLFPET